jgi:competence ComEA-like helix-hairpin-helix protein
VTAIALKYGLLDGPRSFSLFLPIGFSVSSANLSVKDLQRFPAAGRKWWVMDPETAARRSLAGNPRMMPRRDADAKLAGRRLNLNTATLEELEVLPGVGPVLARRTIDDRPYRSVDDLKRVKGIGRKRLEKIRPLARAE